jgi:hypothetical protein
MHNIGECVTIAVPSIFFPNFSKVADGRIGWFRPFRLPPDKRDLRLHCKNNYTRKHGSHFDKYCHVAYLFRNLQRGVLCAANCIMTDECRTRKDLERSSCGLSRQYPNMFGSSVENHKNTVRIADIGFESESESLYDWRFTANQLVLAPNPLRPATSTFVRLNTCGYSPFVTSSLTRQWVCRLQLLLALASAAILRTESRENHYHISLSQTRDPPTWSARSLYLYHPGIVWPSFTPRHWVPLSSPFTTRRATVEEFEPTSTRGRILGSHTAGYEEFWDITPCNPLKANRRFRLTCRLPHETGKK